MEKLKLCPFCGGEARVRQPIIVKGVVAITCTNGKCGADVFFYGADTNRKEAVRRWNRRAERSEASLCDNCDERNDKGCCVCKYIKERSEE